MREYVTVVYYRVMSGIDTLHIFDNVLAQDTKSDILQNPCGKGLELYIIAA